MLVLLSRARIETLFPAAYGRLAQLAKRFRQQVKEALPTINQRRAFWENIFQGEVAERVFAGRDDEAAQLLEDELNGQQGQVYRGEVYLVGAGPGDPDLLTVKAVNRLAQADVVLYDDLSSGPILALVREGAELIAVGKRAGRPIRSCQRLATGASRR